MAAKNIHQIKNAEEKAVSPAFPAAKRQIYKAKRPDNSGRFLYELKRLCFDFLKYFCKEVLNSRCSLLAVLS